MLPEFNGGFIHMALGQPLNGRIYDPNLGRFMTADPHVQAAGYSQSYNRYTYVYNNPLTGTDPSGFFSLVDPLYEAHRSVTSGAIEDVLRNPGEIFNWYALEHSLPGRAALDKHVFSHDWGQAIGHIAIGVGSLFCTGAAPACFVAGEAHIAGYNTWLAGGAHDDVAEAIITSGSIAAISTIGSSAIGGANLSPISSMCPQLRKEAILVAEEHPTMLMSSEHASYSPKFGYVLRYSRRESIEMLDSTVGDVNSTVILFTKDCSLVHLAIVYAGPGTE